MLQILKSYGLWPDQMISFAMEKPYWLTARLSAVFVNHNLNWLSDLTKMTHKTKTADPRRQPR